MSDVAIHVEDLNKSFREGTTIRKVLQHLQLSILQGQTTALIGPSGVGKSTLLHLLGLLDKPTSGKISLLGRDSSSFNSDEMNQFRNRNIGFVFQFHYLLPEFTVLENLLMPRLIANLNLEEGKTLAQTLLTSFGLESRINSPVSVLSGGEAQRIATIRAMMNQPKILLADEPTGNLDLENGKLLIQFLFEYANRENATLIIATHNLEFANQCGSIIELRQFV